MNIRPNSLNIVFGRKRCGKSTFACYLARKWIKQGYNVYSNMPIPNTLPISPDDLGKFHIPERSLVLIDEIDKADLEFPNDLLLFLLMKQGTALTTENGSHFRGRFAVSCNCKDTSR